MLDLACSVAAGVPWLGHFTCPPSGPVLVFLGEGGERAMVRRLEAICAHKHLDHLGATGDGAQAIDHLMIREASKTSRGSMLCVL